MVQATSRRAFATARDQALPALVALADTWPLPDDVTQYLVTRFAPALRVARRFVGTDDNQGGDTERWRMVEARWHLAPTRAQLQEAAAGFAPQMFPGQDHTSYVQLSPLYGPVYRLVRDDVAFSATMSSAFTAAFHRRVWVQGGMVYDGAAWPGVRTLVCTADEYESLPWTDLTKVAYWLSREAWERAVNKYAVRLTGRLLRWHPCFWPAMCAQPRALRAALDLALAPREGGNAGPALWSRLGDTHNCTIPNDFAPIHLGHFLEVRTEAKRGSVRSDLGLTVKPFHGGAPQWWAQLILDGLAAVEQAMIQPTLDSLDATRITVQYGTGHVARLFGYWGFATKARGRITSALLDDFSRIGRAWRRALFRRRLGGPTQTRTRLAARVAAQRVENPRS
jgi:hypothetical protein